MRKILPFISLNRKIIKKEEAMLSAFDDGLLSGLGVFTTIKVRRAVPLFLKQHLARLELNAKNIGITYDINLENDIYKIIEKNKLKQGGLRVTITAGNSLKTNHSPACIIYGFSFKSAVQKVAVITTEDNRDAYKILKTTNRIANILAHKQAQRNGAQDAIFTTDGHLIESTYANIYSYKPDKTITTPPIAGFGLNGISRQILMEFLPIREEELPQTTHNPLILVSSLSIRIVEKINGRDLHCDKDFIKLITGAVNKAEISYINSVNTK